MTSSIGITHDRYGFYIDGEHRFLLAGTIAYFRLARADWRDCLTLLRECGFNTVDVYVPWNYHEATDGVFDFQTENRDLAAYLALCQELGLHVYFRPGPYICNEWDGGGLPAWLSTKPEVRLRQTDPVYLSYVHRYLARINEIVRPFLHTNGGPIILYALENELDFFPCDDPHGYISALRDQAIAEGITVPLTACIGMRTPIRAATGLVDGVLPTPNIYEGRFIERESAHARKGLHDCHYASGAPMRDVPAFVTEMGRDENSLKRILSTGYRGLGPFNFAGGANFGYTHAVNNWNNLSYLATSIDFAGMIGFDGRLQPAFYDARRFAGLIRAFESEILTTEPVTSLTGGPTCDNPLLGANTSEQSPHQVYSLTGADERAFVFLPNLTDAPQTAHVQVGDLVFPRHSTLTVAPGYTHIALANLPLDRHGIPALLRYSTAEVAGLTQKGGTTRLLLCGERDTEGELCLTSAHPIQASDLPATIRLIPDTDTATLVFRFGDRCATTLQIGDTLVHLAIMNQETAAHDGLQYTPPAVQPLDLLTLPRSEQSGEVPTLRSAWSGNAGKPLEALGAYHGADWYEFAFDITATDADTTTTLTIPHAGDLLTAFVDGVYCGTFVGDGGPLAIPLPIGSAPGRHTLLLRAEIWGHSNFHDERWPSARLGSLRGAWGTPTINGTAINGEWQFAPEPPLATAPNPERKTIQGTIYAEGGEAQQVIFELPDLSDTPRGALLTLEGNDGFGEIRIGSRVVGRFLFGPALAVALTGGPANRFFLPGAFLAAGEPLAIVLRGAGNGGAITTAQLEVFTDATP